MSERTERLQYFGKLMHDMTNFLIKVKYMARLLANACLTYSRSEMTRRTHCSLSSFHFENTLAVSVVPRISFVSVSVFGCKTRRARHSFSGLTFPRWPRFSPPKVEVAPRSTLLEIASLVLLSTYVFFFSPLPAGRSGHQGLDVCFWPGLLPLPTTPAGLVSRRSCCCARASEIQTDILLIGTRHQRLVVLNWLMLFPRLLG